MYLHVPGFEATSSVFLDECVTRNVLGSCYYSIYATCSKEWCGKWYPKLQIMEMFTGTDLTTDSMIGCK